MTRFRRVDVSTYQRIDVSTYRSVGVSTYRRINVSTYRRVGVSTYRRINVSTCWRINISTCRRINISTYQRIDVSTYRRVGVSTYQRINVSVYQRIDVSTYQRFDVSMYRRINVSAYQRINVSTCRRINVSTYQRIDVSTYQSVDVSTYENMYNFEGCKRGTLYYLIKMNSCQLCKRTFRSAHTLESHTAKCHKKSVKKIKCKVCPRAFSSYGDYFRHRKHDHNLPLLPENNKINRSNSEYNSLKSLTIARKAQLNDSGNDDTDEDELIIDDFESMPDNIHDKSFRTTNNNLDTKSDSEYGESTDHRECLMEMEECNKMITFYKKKVQQLENENNALEVEIS